MLLGGASETEVAVLLNELFNEKAPESNSERLVKRNLNHILFNSNYNLNF